MATRVQVLNVLVIALVTASHLVCSVSSSRLLHESNAAEADASTSGDHESFTYKKFHGIDFRQLRESRKSAETEVATTYNSDYGHEKVWASKTASSSSATATTESTESDSTAPYFPDYETHDNSPGFNGRRRLN